MKNKRFLKITLIAAVVALLCAALCGCSLIQGILHPEGKFALSESEITLKIGETYDVTLSDGRTDEFTLSTSDKTKVEIYGRTSIKAVGKTKTAVTITATNGKGDTAELKVNVDYADVSTVKIGVENQYQLLQSGETPKSVDFSATLNDGTNPATVFSWKFTNGAGEEVATASGKTASYLPSPGEIYFATVTADGKSATVGFCADEELLVYLDKYRVGTEEKIVVRARYFDNSGKTAKAYVYDEDGNLISTTTLETILSNGMGEVNDTIAAIGNEGTFTLKVVVGEVSRDVSFVVKDNVAANHIEVGVTGNLSQTTAETVTFTATLSPAKADVESVKWYVNDKYYSTGKTFSFKPTNRGEYKVTAEINKITKTKTIVYLSEHDEAWYYASHFHDYGGYAQNRYITSKEDLKNLILFVLENKIAEITFYAGYATPETVKNDVSEVRDCVEESGIIPGYSLETSANEFTIKFRFFADEAGVIETVNSPEYDAPDGFMDAVQNTYSKPHYDNVKKTRNFYIDSVKETMSVSTSNMLYKAVAWGYKPVFMGSQAENLKQIYDNAKDALSYIVSDEMSEYEKVHAIYDYIIYNVRYDHDCANAEDKYVSGNLSLNEKMKYYGYYLEGIFLDKFYKKDMHAVCDGKSKAFVLMCGIEGITAVRISGEASSDGKNFGGHAWNKVLLDLNGTGDKEWYFVDTTWGDVGDNSKEFLSHAYFLLSDDEVKNTHVENSGHDYPKAEGKFDYYAHETYTSNGTEYNYVITNRNLAAQQMARALKTLPPSTIVEFEFAFSLTKDAAKIYAEEAMQKAVRVERYSFAIIRSNVLVIMIGAAA
ncbi:MAG: transglutaminase domain-containing protein [Clostridiales bacterium]|nr:transglutaminase domain-containing protein [Clostridiales bacterium]MDY5529654.1 transglutaminase domain-containing protein [Eubacteriales bacterium]